MKTHVLKCHPGPFAAVRDGQKRHEVRVNDRDYQPGDRVEQHEWVPVGTHSGGFMPTPGYTGHVITATVGHVTRGGEWGIPEGLCVFTLLDVEVVS